MKKQSKPSVRDLKTQECRENDARSDLHATARARGPQVVSILEDHVASLLVDFICSPLFEEQCTPQTLIARLPAPTPAHSGSVGDDVCCHFIKYLASYIGITEYTRLGWRGV